MDQQITLSPFTRIKRSSDVIRLGFGTASVHLNLSYEKPIFDALDMLLEGTTKADLINNLTEKYSHVVADHVLELLNKGKHIVQQSFFSNENRYSRNKTYYHLIGGDDTAEEKIQSSHVCIIGCGGIGNLISMGLAGLGIRKLTFIDDDNIEFSNLSRQFAFSESDVELHKASVLSREVRKRNSNVSVNPILTKIDCPKDLSTIIPDDVDLIILSADKPENIVFWTNDFCVKNKIAFINVGYVEDWVSFGPFFIPDQTSCYRCGQLIAKNEGLDLGGLKIVEKINSRYQVPSSPSTNTISAGMALNDIILYLGGISFPVSANTKQFYLPNTFELKSISISRNPDCEVCGKESTSE